VEGEDIDGAGFRAGRQSGGGHDGAVGGDREAELLLESQIGRLEEGRAMVRSPVAGVNTDECVSPKFDTTWSVFHARADGMRAALLAPEEVRARGGLATGGRRSD